MASGTGHADIKAALCPSAVRVLPLPCGHQVRQWQPVQKVESQKCEVDCAAA